MQVRQCFVTMVQNQFAKGGQVRRFEREGVEKCIVSFDKSTETFELTESDTHQSYQFDNIDIVAMEIYDLIQ